MALAIKYTHMANRHEREEDVVALGVTPVLSEKGASVLRSQLGQASIPAQPPSCFVAIWQDKNRNESSVWHIQWWWSPFLSSPLTFYDNPWCNQSLVSSKACLIFMIFSACIMTTTVSSESGIP